MSSLPSKSRCGSTSVGGRGGVAEGGGGGGGEETAQLVIQPRRLQAWTASVVYHPVRGLLQLSHTDHYTLVSQIIAYPLQNVGD